MKNHPYHYSAEKDLFQRLIDLGVPLGLFLLYFLFYNFGKITPSEVIKTSGLLAIALLSLTLIIGSVCRFFPSLDFLKAHRKFWGISAFFVALTHVTLVFVYFYNFNFLKFIDFSNPKYLGILTGLIALFILAIVTATSTKKAVESLTPKNWKLIQNTAYLALILAVLHFYIVESKDGVLVIKRVVGQITFGFALLTILMRLFVLILPNKK